MASFEVGTILINTAHLSWVEGDKIDVLYDSSTASFLVEKNGATLPATPTPDGIFEFGSTFFTVYVFRNSTGYSFLQGNAKVYFSPIQAYPYYQVKSAPIVGDGINDVAISVVSITDATSSGTNDGSITVTANGTNTPFQYSKDGSNYQESGTFSGLYDGNSTITVQDSRGYTASIDVLVNILDVVPLDSNVKFRMEFLEERANTTRDGTKHRVDILLLGYTDTITEVLSGSTPLIINARGEGSQPGVDVTVVSHELNITLLAESFGQFREFAEASEYSYLVRYYVDDSVAKDGSDYNIRFKGYITPESYTEEYFHAPYYVTISATDRLADLIEIPYEPSPNISYTGLSNEITIINNCLSKLKLSQGYRIALDMYETSMSTSNTSPLHQAYVLQDVYKESNMTCGDVMRAILQPYGAVLISWGGFFYIIKEEEWENATIAYNEFGGDLAYDTNDTISSRITFKAATNTNLFRFTGRQSLSFTRPVKNINIHANTVTRDSGVINPINESTVLYEPYLFNLNFPGLEQFYLQFASTIKGFKGYELVINNDLFQRAVIDTKGDLLWSITMVDNIPSLTYIRVSNKVTHSANDKFELKFNVRVSFNVGYVVAGVNPGTPAAYLNMKWMLKVGSSYLQHDGSWDTTQTINQFWIEQSDVNKFTDFSIDGNFPPGITEATEETYELRLYPVSAWEYDSMVNLSAGVDILSFSGSATATNRTNLINTLKTAESDVYSNGSRIIARYNENGSDYWYYCYYECQFDASPSNNGIDRIVFTDDTIKYWDLKYTWYEDISGAGDQGRTRTDIKDIEFHTLPNGVEAPKDYPLITKTNGAVNNKDLNVSLFHFDLPDTVNNDENIYLNYTRLSDGTPTTVWSRGGGVLEKTRQEHLADRLFSLYKQPRYQMNVSFYSDMELSMLNHLYVSDDNGRIFILNGIEVNPKTGLHSGEILEIYNTGQPVVGEFNNDFDTDNEYA